MSKETVAGMEIDISKVIGDELAKLASSMISEERLTNLVKYEMEKLVEKPVSGYGWNNKESELTTETTKAFMRAVAAKIDEIVNSEEHKVFVEQRAKAIYDMAFETATKYMVEGIATRLAVSAFDIDNRHEKCQIQVITNQIIEDHKRNHHGGY